MKSLSKRGAWLLLLLSLFSLQLHVALHHHSDEKLHQGCPLCILSLSFHLLSHPELATLLILFLGSLNPGKSLVHVFPPTLSLPPLRGPPEESLLP